MTRNEIVSNTIQGRMSRFDRTVAAIKLLKSLEEEDRLPSLEEKQILKGFEGFGPLAKVFDEKSKSDILRSILTEEEYKSAARSTPTAFYTSEAVMKFMYDALYHMGLDGEIIHALEPGCGSGNFIGVAPNNAFVFTGVEQDSLSARIAAKLYPKHIILNDKFQKCQIAGSSMDVVIGNVPFGNINIDYHGKNYSIHDYFILRSLDALRDGGFMIIVTSAFTMDKVDTKIRQMISNKAGFIGAVRLPNQAFKQQGTEVLTDILVFQKGAKDHHPWINSYQAQVFANYLMQMPGEGAVNVNEYYLHYPDRILADEIWIGTKMYARPSLQCKLESDLLHPRFQDAIKWLPKGIYVPRVPTVDDQKTEDETFEFSGDINVARDIDTTHLREGSFVVSDGFIYQIMNGHPDPVIKRGKHVDTSSKDGNRIAKFVAVRDAVKAVIYTQREQLSIEMREASRGLLHMAYDDFVADLGPVNSISVSETKDGRIIRRYINVNAFKSDPDSYLVMSIEQYDEKSNTAKKGTIFFKDVVAPVMEPTISNPDDALIASMVKFGRVNLDWMSEQLCANTGKSWDVVSIFEKLKGRIFYDTEQDRFVLREAYLSGNVRRKLNRLVDDPECDHYVWVEENRKALEGALPEPIPFEKIIVNIGAGWIPAQYYKKFAEEEIGGRWEVKYLSPTAKWFTEMRGWVNNDPFSTKRVEGERLFDDLLNGKLTQVYDSTGDGSRKLNEAETTAAIQAQDRMNRRFRHWIWEDMDRTEHVTQLYNENFNSIVLREYDGSHLNFPGMNAQINLRKHQVDNIYRAMVEKSTLFAHATGAGKSFTMMAAGMGLKQMGLRSKLLYVVPNHMLEQFSREFLFLYPDANLLVTQKEDLQKDRRRLFIAKVATNDYDGIIMTHSMFEKIVMSYDFQKSFSDGLIENYDLLLDDHYSGSDRSVRKEIEKQKENLENKLDKLFSDLNDGKDSHIFFDELGIDHIFIDEAHEYKNLETPTKQTRVMGIQTSGSQKSMNLYMITEYLHGKGNAGITLATATPITNSLVEMYTMQRYLMPEELRQMGVEHFDAWSKAFGEMVTKLELKADAKTVKMTTRFGKFHNVPELLTMFNMVTDIKRPQDLNLPVPKAVYETVVVEASQDLLDFQNDLQKRYMSCKSSSKKGDDNALRITSDGRKAALDLRLVWPFAEDDPSSKVNTLVDNVYHIWLKYGPAKGTQMIFGDIGVNSKSMDGFEVISIYDDIVDKLITRGIPKDQVAKIGDYNSDAKKGRLFEKMRNGEVRILLGSTKKMGTGTNVQKRLVALHHLDCPWRPADLEQRDGRIIRQGNTWDEVYIFRYITKRSFDAVMWQKIEQKSQFVNQVMSNNITDRSIDDIGTEQSLEFAEVAAAASGNPEILELAKCEAEIKSLELGEEAYESQVRRLKRDVLALPEKIGNLRRNIEYVQGLIGQHKPSEEGYYIRSEVYEKAKEADVATKHVLQSIPFGKSYPLVNIKGLVIYGKRSSSGIKFHVGPDEVITTTININETLRESTQLMRRFENLIVNVKKKPDLLAEQVEKSEDALASLRQRLATHEAQVAAKGSGYEFAEKLASLRDRKKEIEAILSGKKNPESNEQDKPMKEAA